MMRTVIPFDFTQADRAAVARCIGYERRATHIECVGWARQQLRGTLTLMAQAPPPRKPVGARPTLLLRESRLDQ